MYQNKIRELENTYRNLGDQIFNLEKSGVADAEQIKKLNNLKIDTLNELRSLRKLQWDYDHEYVKFDDDR
jgi:hypothetical protein